MRSGFMYEDPNIWGYGLDLNLDLCLHVSCKGGGFQFSTDDKAVGELYISNPSFLNICLCQFKVCNRETKNPLNLQVNV